MFSIGYNNSGNLSCTIRQLMSFLLFQIRHKILMSKGVLL